MKVVNASLNQAITASELGIHGDYTLNDVKHPSIKMETVDHGLLVERNGRKALIPYANVRSLILGSK